MRILVLGATGSIGQQTISIIKKLKYQLVGISFNINSKLAAHIKTKYKYSPSDYKHSNVRSFSELIKKSNPDIVVNAIVGFAGLKPTIVTIQNKKTLCLANKESLVVAGKFITQLAKQNHVKIYPIDSEHTALYQIISQTPNKRFKKIYITASGGPFYKLPKNQWHKITYQEAIKHPTWKMGNKISIDSSTLINKCYEIIEAYWYFHTKNIEPLYHPQSLVHAIVQYSKKKLMFVSKPDMKLSIYQALTQFKKTSMHVITYDRKYQLEKIDSKKWIPIKWAYQVLKKPNSSLPIIINIANEYAINLFRVQKIKFDDIIPLITKCINHFKVTNISSFPEVFSLQKKINNYLNYKFIKQNNTK